MFAIEVDLGKVVRDTHGMKRPDLSELTALHQALADPTRLRIIRLLLVRPCCVCELVGALEEPQYKVSRHLSVLREAGLVQDAREGTFSIYRLTDEAERRWRRGLQALAGVWDASPQVARARERLASISFRNAK